MKKKRLVSLLLAILLMVGMIPTNALAAIEQGSKTGTDVVEFTLLASADLARDTTKTPDENGVYPYYTYNHSTQAARNVTVDSITKYKSLLGGLAAMYNGDLYAASAEDAVKFYSKVFVPESTGSISVEKGQTFYVGLKAKLLNPSTYKGLKNPQFQFRYKNDEFEVVPAAGKNASDYVDNAGSNGVASLVAANGVGVLKFTATQSATDNEISGLDTEEGKNKYAADFNVDANGCNINNSADGTYAVVTITYGGSNWYIPSDVPWDVIVPLRAKKAVTNGKIELLADFDKNGDGSAHYYCNVNGCKIANGGDLGSSSAGAVNLKSNAGSDNFFGTDITVTATSSDPTLTLSNGQAAKIPTGKASNVKVTVNKDTFAAGATTVGNWTATNATINSVTATAGSTEATVNLTPTAAGKISLTAKGAAVTKGADVAGTDLLEAVAAPGTIEMAAANDGSVTITPAAATGIEYKVGSGNWTAINAAKTISEADLNTAAGTGSSVTVSLAYSDSKTNTDLTVTKTINRNTAPTVTVGTAAASGKVVLDYVGEKVYAQDLMIAVNGAAASKGTATATTLTLDAASGISLDIYAPGSATGIRSTSVKYSGLKRTPHAALTTNTTSPTDKKAGKTTVGGLTNGDKYTVAAAEPADWSTISTTATGTSVTVNATTDQKVWAMTPAVNGATPQASKFATKGVSVAGVGNNFGTITVSGVTKDSAAITLNIVGDTFAATDGTGITIKKDGTPITATWSGTTSALTATVDALQPGAYTIEATAAAVTGSNAPKFGDSAAATYSETILDEAGYTLKVAGANAEGLTLTPNTFKANAPAAKVTIGNIPDGKEVKSVSGTGVSGFTAPTPEFTYTAPKGSAPAQQTNVEITITLGDIEYDALTYEDTSVGHGSAISVAPKTKDARITDLKLNSVAPADKQSEFAVAADGTITVTTPDNLTPNTTYTVTVGSTSIATYTGTATIKVGKAGATVTVANKFYDGTNAVPADKITVTADKGGATLDITITGATFADANVGAGKAVSIANATITGDDAANYTVNTSGITGEIEQLTGAQVKAETTTAAQVGSIADIVAAVKKQTVTIDGVTADLGTVADIASDTDIETAVKAALDASGSAAVIAPGDQIEANVVEADASKASAAPIAVEQYAGGKITLTGIPEGATAAIKSGNATLTDGVLTGLTSETVVVTVTPETGDPYDVEIAVTAKADPTENVYDFTKLSDTTLNITVSNLTGDITTNTDATEITVTVPVTKKSSSSGGGYVPSTGYTVAIENTGYGSVDTTAITTDEDGKIVSLPTVTNVKKGVSFVGWSTNGQISGVIDPNTFRVQNDELTLTAVYQGYMAGYEDSTARPNKQITRAELLKMLIVATGDYDATKNYGTSTFTDVKNAWYVNYIACAQQSGKDIIAGYGDGTFKPNAPVTRNEAARMICQAFGVTVSEGDTTNKVNDFSKVAGWAQKYVAALCNNGTIHGYEDGEFKGDRAVTRGESSVMINGYLGLTDAAKEQLRNDPALKNIFKDMTDKQAWNFIDVLFAAMCAPASYYSDEITMPQA